MLFSLELFSMALGILFQKYVNIFMYETVKKRPLLLFPNSVKLSGPGSKPGISSLEKTALGELEFF